MQIVLILHNLLRWAVLLLGIWTVYNALSGYFGKRKFTATDNRSNLLFMVSCDIMLLIGIALYFSNGWFAHLKDLSQTSKDPYLRFFTLQHTTQMLLAWVLVHIGRVAVKKGSTDIIKHRRMLVFFGLALVIILAAIPWPMRAYIGRPLFRIG